MENPATAEVRRRDLSRAAGRITGVLFAAQCLASAAFIATSTVSAIAGVALSGQRSLAGVPAAASTLAGSGAAFLWGMLMDRMGRRPALVLGLLFGAVGSALCIWGITAGSFLVFVGGMMLLGVANAAVDAEPVRGSGSEHARAARPRRLHRRAGRHSGSHRRSPPGEADRPYRHAGRHGRPGRGLWCRGSPAPGGRGRHSRGAPSRAADACRRKLEAGRA